MKNSTINIDINYSLNNNDNYLKIFPDKHSALDNLYILIFEYLRIIFEHNKIKKSASSNFVIIRGLETIINVYLILLYNTNNVDLSFYHAQHAYIFYLEFVEQITDEQHKFLQLTSRDATMYVYKKTIFEVKRDIIKTTAEKDIDFKYITLMSNLLKLIGTILIQEKSFDADKIKNLFHKIKKNKLTYDQTIILINFISKIENKCHVIDELLKIINKVPNMLV
jgi:hypothetical protein